MKGRLLIDVSVVSVLLAYHFNGPPASLLELAVVWCGSRCAAEFAEILTHPRKGPMGGTNARP